MRKALRWRYYCDHCKKSGGHGHHIETHEKHCVKNPDRDCRMCDMNPNHCAQEETPALVEAMNRGGLAALRELTHGCPACILTGVVHWRKTLAQDDDRDVSTAEFDYRAEAKAWLAAHPPEDWYAY